MSKKRLKIILLLIIVPLIIAIKYSNLPSNLIHYYIRSNNTKKVELLIKLGVDVNKEHPKHNGSPIYWATYKNNYELIEFLIKNGADVNDVLLSAIHSGNLDKAEYAIKKGADINRKIDSNYHKEKGYSPLILAIALNNYDLAKYFIENGANLESRDNFGRTALHNAAILCFNPFKTDSFVDMLYNIANVNSKDNLGFTPLQHCAINHNIECVKAFIKNGADIHMKDEKGRSLVDLNNEVYLLYSKSNGDQNYSYKEVKLVAKSDKDKIEEFNNFIEKLL